MQTSLFTADVTHVSNSLVSFSSIYITVMETSHTLSNHTSKWTQYVAHWDTVLFFIDCQADLDNKFFSYVQHLDSAVETV